MLGFGEVTTDGAGNADIPFFAASPTQFVTATATNSSSNTSEFSACVRPDPTTTRTWISDASGFWEDSANWSDGIVPRDGDDVVIDRPGANPVVTVRAGGVTVPA